MRWGNLCKAVRWGEVLENNILEKNIFAQIFLSKIFPNEYIFICYYKKNNHLCSVRSVSSFRFVCPPPQL